MHSFKSVRYINRELIRSSSRNILRNIAKSYWLVINVFNTNIMFGSDRDHIKNMWSYLAGNEIVTASRGLFW